MQEEELHARGSGVHVVVPKWFPSSIGVSGNVRRAVGEQQRIEQQADDGERGLERELGDHGFQLVSFGGGVSGPVPGATRNGIGVGGAGVAEDELWEGCSSCGDISGVVARRTTREVGGGEQQ